MTIDGPLRVLASILAALVLQPVASAKVRVKKGYDISPTGLRPAYPRGYACSPLTSLYASLIDVDGTRRDQAHSGIDGGRLGEPVLAPAPGVVRAVWKANWRWGDEGALLIRNTRKDLNLKKGPPFYYSAFYHLKYEDVRKFKPGDPIARGQKLGKVFRPGGKWIYAPEVHLEIYEVENDGILTWHENKYGAKAWNNDSARLIDPLYLMAQQRPPSDDRQVEVTPYENDVDFSGFRGFSYILPCRKKVTKRRPP